MEKMRKQYVFAIIFLLAVIAGFGGTFMFKSYNSVGVVTTITIWIGIFCAMLGFWTYKMCDNSFRKRLKRKFMYDLAEENGFDYDITGMFDVDTISIHRIVPPHDESTTEDGFRGEMNGVPFVIQEIFLENIGHKGRRIEVFKGLAIRLLLEKPLDFHTIALPSKSRDTVRRSEVLATTQDFKKVGLSSKFEHKYHVLSTDQIESRMIFDPAFMERFLDLCDQIQADNVSASFRFDQLVILARSRKNHFELGHVMKTLNSDDFALVFEDLNIIERIIDTLKLTPLNRA